MNGLCKYCTNYATGLDKDPCKSCFESSHFDLKQTKTKKYITFVSSSGGTYTLKKSSFEGYMTHRHDDTIMLIFSSSAIDVDKDEFERIKGELL